MFVQKDSHTVYLEQELESLKVVLEIKNNQLHQKEKKLMEMDKLVGIAFSTFLTVFLESLSVNLCDRSLQVETNVKLEECLTKVQQENEDYRARMDKHAALSKYVPPAASAPGGEPSLCSLVPHERCIILFLLVYVAPYLSALILTSF